MTLKEFSYFSPNHFVYDTYITLDDLDNLGADILIGVVGYGSAVVAIADEFDCRINRLKEALGVDAREDESCFVERLRTFGAGADADSREGVAYRGEEAAFFGERAGIGHHTEGVHLEAVVVVEAKGLMLDDAWVELEATGGKAIARTRVAAVEYRHIVFLCELVDGIEEREEVLLGVDILFAMG